MIIDEVNDLTRDAIPHKRPFYHDVIFLVTVLFGSFLSAQNSPKHDPPLSSYYTVGTYVPDGTLRLPAGLAFGKDGSLYIADEGNSVVRKVDLSGKMTIVAGIVGRSEKFDRPFTPVPQRKPGICYTAIGDYCQATNAVLSGPVGLAVDLRGDIYISTYFNSKIRKLNIKTGKITPYAGTTNGWSDTQLHNPDAIAFDSSGNLYVADEKNNAIRKILPPVGNAKYGTMVTIAGLGPDRPGCGVSGSPAASTLLTHPEGVSVDGAGNVYVADTGCRVIRKITPDGIMIAIAGTGNERQASTGEVFFNGRSGPASLINLGTPARVTADPNGNLYISDAAFSLVWYYDAKSATLQTFAGLAPAGPRGRISKGRVCKKAITVDGDGCNGRQAFLNIPSGVALDSKGSIYIAEHSSPMVPAHPFKVRVLHPISANQ